MINYENNNKQYFVSKDGMQPPAPKSLDRENVEEETNKIKAHRCTLFLQNLTRGHGALISHDLTWVINIFLNPYLEKVGRALPHEINQMFVKLDPKI